MKTCPKCNTQYENAMTFCPGDGTELIISSSGPDETPGSGHREDRHRHAGDTHKTGTVGNSQFVPQFENNIDRPKMRTNLLIGVLAGVFVIVGVLAVSWGYNPFAETEDSAGSNSNKNADLPAPVTESGADMTRINEGFYDGLKEKLQTAAAKNGLKPLVTTTLPKDGIEIRFYLFASFYAPIYKGAAIDDTVLILKRTGSTWSGKIIRNIIKSNSDKDNAKEKIVTELNPPASGWEGLWQKLQANGILAPPTKSETEVKTSSTLYMIEGRENGKYTYSYFHMPKENSGIEEEKRIAAAFNLLAKEFEAADLKAY